MSRALARTAADWPDLEAAYTHIWAAARILGNEQGERGEQVRERLAGVLTAMAPRAGQSDWLKQALGEFRKVSARYGPGLFYCYDVSGLERTNNALEQFFGSWRWHERRASGRKGASRSEVLAGPASLASSLATRVEAFDGEALAAVNLERWREVRAQIEARQAAHRQRCTFRRDPEHYLADLQQRTVKLVLPP